MEIARNEWRRSTRRELLAGVGGASATLLAGCSTTVGTGPAPTLRIGARRSPVTFDPIEAQLISSEQALKRVFEELYAYDEGTERDVRGCRCRECACGVAFSSPRVDNGVGGWIAMAYIVGVLLALGPFDHVVVTVLHVFFGMRFGADIAVGALGTVTAVVTAGNVVGGLGLVTFSHIAQVRGSRRIRLNDDDSSRGLSVSRRIT